MLSTTKSSRWGRILTLGLTLALSLALFGCGPAKTETPAEAPKVEDKTPEPVATRNLVLASTTSTQDSGLFDVLIPAFEAADEGVKVQVIAVGTGEALQKGRDGDADVLLVHAKKDEEQLVADGVGTERRDVMYNDFIVVGPDGDPAGVAGSADAAAALKKIMDSGATFVSRGDDSGTNKKELSIWKAAGVETPSGAWYKVAGQGMGDTLKMTDEMGAYTLADRATYLKMQKEGAIELKIAFEGAADLLNQYGVIPVADAKNLDDAVNFMEWITSAEGQEVISKYGVEDFGGPLFFPNAK